MAGLKALEVRLTKAARIEAALAAREVPGSAASSPGDASKDRPFINSLGMPFVPIKGTKVLFCIFYKKHRDGGEQELEKVPMGISPRTFMAGAVIPSDRNGCA